VSIDEERLRNVRTGGHTTVVQRLLDARAKAPRGDEGDTTTTIAVMLRGLPPPRALVAVGDQVFRREVEQRIAQCMLDYESVGEDAEALKQIETESRALVITDNLELIRRVRAQVSNRAPFIVYMAELDDSDERRSGLVAGADECIARRASEREWLARIGTGRRIAELEAVLRTTLADNRRLSTIDDLTRVSSRRFFAKNFPKEVERAARYGRALSLILCDIDGFKAINDTLGHLEGDAILRQFGPRLQKLLRAGVDWVARIGGEEFAIVLPETRHDAALESAKRLLAAIAQTPFNTEGQPLKVTASFGLCGLDCVPVGERKMADRMLKAADSALYRSKHEGRNRVTTALPTGRGTENA
jgi:two-component system, cell cycle response regulator